MSKCFKSPLNLLWIVQSISSSSLLPDSMYFFMKPHLIKIIIQSIYNLGVFFVVVCQRLSYQLISFTLMVRVHLFSDELWNLIRIIFNMKNFDMLYMIVIIYRQCVESMYSWILDSSQQFESRSYVLVDLIPVSFA